MNSLIKRAIIKIGGENLFRYFQFRYWLRNILKGKFADSEISILDRFIKPGDTVLDIGAHFGRYAYPISNLVGKQGKVIAFEPVVSTFSILQKIIGRLSLSNIFLYNKAASDSNGHVTISIPLDEYGLEISSMSHLKTDQEEESRNRKTQEIESVKIDDFLSVLDVSRVSFIKCDVEGAELFVFKGAERTITKYFPTIFCEIEARHTQRFGYAPDTLVNYLRGLGYSIYVFDSIMRDMVPIEKHTPHYNNYFFIKSDPTAYTSRSLSD